MTTRRLIAIVDVPGEMPTNAAAIIMDIGLVQDVTVYTSLSELISDLNAGLLSLDPALPQQPIQTEDPDA